MTVEEAERAEMERERAAARAEEVPTHAPVLTLAPAEVDVTVEPENVPTQLHTVADDQYRPASSFNLYELLCLYEFGAARLRAADATRWRTAFALAASTGGIWALRSPEKIGYLCVFWRTKNPHVNLAREFPHPSPEGNHAYVGWQWNETGLGSRVLRLCAQHIIRRLPGIDFIAGHDNRTGIKKSRRGKLWLLNVAGRHVASNGGTNERWR